MYNDPDCKPWTSSSWAPLGFSSRHELVEQGRAAERRKPLASGALDESRVEKTGSGERLVHDGNGVAHNGNGGVQAPLAADSKAQ